MVIGIHPSHKVSHVYMYNVFGVPKTQQCMNDFHKSWLKLNEVHLRIVYMYHILCRLINCNHAVTLLGIVNVLNTVIRLSELFH